MISEDLKPKWDIIEGLPRQDDYDLIRISSGCHAEISLAISPEPYRCLILALQNDFSFDFHAVEREKLSLTKVPDPSRRPSLSLGGNELARHRGGRERLCWLGAPRSGASRPFRVCRRNAGLGVIRRRRADRGNPWRRRYDQCGSGRQAPALHRLGEGGASARPKESTAAAARRRSSPSLTRLAGRGSIALSATETATAEPSRCAR